MFKSVRNSSAALIVMLLALAACGSTNPSTPEGGGAQSANQPSRLLWPAPKDVPSRVADAGLELGPMGMAEHYHPTLRVVVRGTEIAVPPNIGVDPTTGAMSSLHTHEPDGTLHIEAKRRGQRFTLGQFFKEWGVPLTSRAVGGTQSNTGRVVVTSNGKRVRGEPGRLRLRPEQQIVVRVP